MSSQSNRTNQRKIRKFTKLLREHPDVKAVSQFNEERGGNFIFKKKEFRFLGDDLSIDVYDGDMEEFLSDVEKALGLVCQSEGLRGAVNRLQDSLYASLAEEGVAAPMLPPGTGMARKRRRSSESSEEPPFEAADVATAVANMKQVLALLTALPCVEPYLERVDPRRVPGYADIVTHPMDLSLIARKVDAGAYKLVAGELKRADGLVPLRFLADIEQVWANCLAYNHPESDIVAKAKWLKRRCTAIVQHVSTGKPIKIAPNDVEPPQAAAVPAVDPTLPAAPSDHKRMKLILNEFCAIPEASPFLYPVNLAEVAGYKEMIKQPMDFSTVRARLKDYDNNWKAFKDDMELIFKNCMQFNVEGSDIYQVAEKLLFSFRDRLKMELRKPEATTTAAPATTTGSDLKQMKLILNEFCAIPEASPFLYPVNLAEVAGYKEMIKQPMDFSTVRARLKDYDNNWKAFKDDMELIFKNCMQFNVEGSAIYQVAEKLLFSFRDRIKMELRKAQPPAPAVAASAARPVPAAGLGSKRMRLLLNEFCAIPEASPFLYPVNLAEVAGYKEMIKQPMDFSTVRARLKDYDNNWKAFKDDMELIFKNCMQFNVEGSDIYQVAEKLLSMFRLRVAEDVEKAPTPEKAAAPAATSHGAPQSDASRKSMKLILNEFCAIPEASPFLYPVNLAEVAGYKEMIKQPMDFSTVRARLKDYDNNWKAFKDDMELIFKNCMQFNVEGSDIYQVAEKLLVTFRSRIETIFSEKAVVADKKPTSSNKVQNVNPKLIPDRSDQAVAAPPMLITNPLTINVAAGNLKVSKRRMEVLFHEICALPESEPFLHARSGSNDKNLSAVRDNMKFYNGDPSLFVKDIEDICASGQQVYPPESAEHMLAGQLREKIREKLLTYFPNPQNPGSEVVRPTTQIVPASGARAVAPVVPELDLHSMGLVDLSKLMGNLARDAVGNSEVVRRECYRKAVQSYPVATVSYPLAIPGGVYEVLNFGYASSNVKFHKSDVIFPVNYKCAVTVRLFLNEPATNREDAAAMVVANGQDDAGMADASDRRFVDVNLQNVVLIDRDDMRFAIVISGTNTVVTEAGSHPKDAWVDLITLGTELIQTLGAGMRRCRAVLNALCLHEDIVPFLDMVDRSGPLGAAYFRAISAPMCFRLIHERLTTGYYSSEYDFAFDVRLVLNNCQTFNAPGSELYVAASELLITFECLFCEWVLNVVDKFVTEIPVGPWNDWQHLVCFDGVQEQIAVDDEKGDDEKTEEKELVVDAMLTCGSCEDVYRSSKLPKRFRPVLPSNGSTRGLDWYCPRCLKFQKADFGDGHSRVNFSGCGNTYNLDSLSYHLRTYQLPEAHVGFVPFDVKAFLKDDGEADDLGKKPHAAELNEAKIRESVLSQGWKKGKSVRMDGTQSIVIQTPSGRLVAKTVSDILVAIEAEVSIFAKKLESRSAEWQAEVEASKKKGKQAKETKAVSTAVVPVRASSRVSSNGVTIADKAPDVASTDDPLKLKAGDCAVLRSIQNVSWTVLSEVSGEDETRKTTFVQISEDRLPLYGYFGFEHPVIRGYIEGLPGALSCVNYQFDAADSTRLHFMDRIKSVLASQEALVSGESRIMAVIRKDFVDCTQIGNSKYVSQSERRSGAVLESFVPFFLEHVASLIELSASDVESIVALWEVLITAKHHVGKTHFGLVDIVKSLRPSHPLVPGTHQIVFDDICTALTGFLLEDVRRVIGVASDNVWNGLLSVKPLNVLTWPAVCHSCLAVQSIQTRHPSFPTELLKALFTSSGNFSAPGNAACDLAHISILLLNHPMIGLFMASGVVIATDAGRTATPTTFLENILERVFVSSTPVPKNEGDNSVVEASNSPAVFQTIDEFADSCRYLWSHALSHSTPESKIYNNALVMATWFELLLKGIGKEALMKVALDTAVYAQEGESSVGIIPLMKESLTAESLAEGPDISVVKEENATVAVETANVSSESASADAAAGEGMVVDAETDKSVSEPPKSAAAEPIIEIPVVPWVCDLQECLSLLKLCEPDLFSSSERLAVYAVLTSTCMSTSLYDQAVNHIVSKTAPPSLALNLSPTFRGGLPEQTKSNGVSPDGDEAVSSVAKQVFQNSLEAVGSEVDMSQAVCHYSGIKASAVGSVERWVYVPHWLLSRGQASGDDYAPHPASIADGDRPICLENVLTRVAFNRAHANTVLKQRLMQMMSLASMNLVSSCVKTDLSESAFSAMAFSGVTAPAAKSDKAEVDAEEEFGPKMFNEQFPTSFVGENAAGSKFWVLGRNDFELLSCMAGAPFVCDSAGEGDEASEPKYPWNLAASRKTNAAVLVLTGSGSSDSSVTDRNSGILTGRWRMTGGDDASFIELMNSMDSSADPLSPEQTDAVKALKATLASKLGEAHICFCDSPFRLLISQQGMLRKLRKSEKWCENVHDAMLQYAEQSGEICLEKKTIGPLSSIDTIRLVDLMWARSAEVRTIMHYGDLAEEVSLDVAPKDLGNVPRMVKDKEYIRRRRVREGLAEELMDLHPRLGFMHVGDSFVRVKSLLSNTNATRLLADQQIHELWQEFTAPHRATYRRNLCDEPFSFQLQDLSMDSGPSGRRDSRGPGGGSTPKDNDEDGGEDQEDEDESDDHDRDNDENEDDEEEGPSAQPNDEANNDSMMDVEEGAGHDEEGDDKSTEKSGRPRRRPVGSESHETPALGTFVHPHDSDYCQQTVGTAAIRRKKIEQLHIVTGEVLRRYDSGTLAAAFMDVSQSGISLCCAGKKAESNGFRWRFYEDPVPEVPYLSREELFDLKRPRREIPLAGDRFSHSRKSYRTAGHGESADASALGKRHRSRDSEGRSHKSARTSHPVEMSANRKHQHDFAIVGVNHRYVSKRVAISNEVLVSTVYVNHRLYKLKSELLNMVALLADFGLYWDALSIDQETSGGGRRAADMFVRFIQGASTAQELLHAITTLETVIPLAGLTRGEHRDAIELLIYNAMADKSSVGPKKVDRAPLPTTSVTSSTVALRLFSLDRIIRYERLPAICAEYLSRSVQVCRTRCDQSARCPFSLYCNKAAGHFGRCICGCEDYSRMPELRPSFDRMIMGEMPYHQDPTTPYLYSSDLTGQVSLLSTQFSNLPMSEMNGGPMTYDDEINGGSQYANRSMRLQAYSGQAMRYPGERYELVTVKILPFDIGEVQPHVPPPEEVDSTEWV